MGLGLQKIFTATSAIVLIVGASACKTSELEVPGSPVAASASQTRTIYTTGFAGGTYDSLQAVAVDGAGRMIAAGFSYNSSNNPRALVIRYLATGAIDTSFNTSGYVLGISGGFAGGGYDGFNAIAIDGSGNIVVAGYAGDSSGRVRTLIARYDPTGALDTSFNTTGYVLGPSLGFASGQNDMIGALALDGGSILVAGHSRDSGGYRKALVARYTSAGALDTGFNTAGYYLGVNYGFSGGCSVTVPVTCATSTDRLNAIGIDSSGNIIGAGATQDGGGNQRTLVIRLTSAGALDTALFNTGPGGTPGYILGESSGFAGSQYDSLLALAIDSSDNIIVGGSSKFGSQYRKSLLVRYTSAGAMDTAAFNSGSTTPGFVLGGYPGYAGGGSDTLTTLAIGSTGKIFAGGYSGDGSNFQVLLIEYDASVPAAVTSTATYRTNVLANSPQFSPASWDSIHSIAIDSSSGFDEVVAAGAGFYGTSDQSVAILRYDSSGVRDF